MIRSCFKSVYHLGLKPTVHQKSKEILLNFIRKRQVITRLKTLFISHGIQLHSVFRKLEANVIRKRERRQELLEMWDQQKLEIINLLYDLCDWYRRKSKKSVKNSRIKRNLLKLPDRIRDTVIRLYIDKCKGGF